MVRRSSLVALAGLLVALAPDPRAEVAARTDLAGNYVATEIVTTGLRGEPVIWGLRGRVARRANILNPRGDQNGDLWPVIVESSQPQRHPWVVWSRFNGTDYDLAWSRWTPQGWRPVEPISPDSTSGDDLDPDLAFDGNGQAFLAWSRDDGGASEIYLSVWLKRRWMTAVVVSEPGVDSRYPVIVGFGDDAVDVEFTTPDGVVLQRVLFSKPGTITDDINPLQHLRVIGTPIYAGDDDGPDWEDR